MPVRTRLVLASALMLFLELALIRWTAANVVHLGYFSNFVLLGSFLGVGLGFLRVERTTKRPVYSPVVLAALVVLVLAFPVTLEREGSDIVFFTAVESTGPPAWLALPLVFVAVAAVLAGPGELVGRCFLTLPRLEAYRLDLIGSLAGIVAFTALAFLRAPSVVWGVVVAVLFTVLLLDRPAGSSRTARRAVSVGTVAAVVAPGLVMVGALAVESLAPGVSWSPYYKVVTDEQGTSREDRTLQVSVNGVPHQAGMDAQRKAREDPQYVLPYERSADPNPARVLVIGAGTGTDVALALQRGAQHVDAVEIDPRLAQIGQERHPDQPYSDPRVTVHVDDGRAFLERTDETYDLIVFALPDSLTLVAGASSLRLESYLFTEQALEAVRDRLAPGGAFAMYNFYRESWLIGRLAGTVAAAFGHAPCVDLVADDNRAVITAGLTPADQRCASTAAVPAGPAPATDDAPFVYLETRSIPMLYVVALSGVLLVSLVAVRAVGGPVRRMRPYADLFLLGAAFLLLETRAVTSGALLFGTTWVVNAIVFGGVLVVVLAAVELTRRLRRPPPLPLVYALLAGSLVLAWLLPPDRLLGLPVGLRVVVAVVVAFLPVFLANLVFASRFADTVDPTSAFAANLLGAMLGGCLEYLSLVVGYSGLLVVAAVLYAGAFVLLRTGSGGPAALSASRTTASTSAS